VTSVAERRNAKQWDALAVHENSLRSVKGANREKQVTMIHQYFGLLAGQCSSDEVVEEPGERIASIITETRATIQEKGRDYQGLQLEQAMMQTQSHSYHPTWALVLSGRACC